MPESFAYLFDTGDGRGYMPNGYWKISGKKIFDSYDMVSEPRYVVPEGETVEEFFQKLDQGTTKKKLVRILENGIYYPRIYRPYLYGSFFTNVEYATINVPTTPLNMGWVPHPINLESYAKSITQLVALRDSLKTIFRVIEPEGQNLDSYGHEIRNLLIVACTEVECQWKAVLRENNCNPIKREYNTCDYVKLLNPLKLSDYKTTLPFYHGVPQLSPFLDWDASYPTQSLDWYNAYNKTKHDRENGFKFATLLHAVNAIAACAILLIAQFGRRYEWNTEIGEFFSFDAIPTWGFDEMYNRDLNQVYHAIDYPL